MNERKVVLITGGAMGQGRTHAVEFAKLGYDCVLLDMLDPSDDRFAETIAQVQAEGGSVQAIKCDITSTADTEAAFAAAWEQQGRLDVVVANAGIINFNYTWDLTDDQVEKALSVNLEGTWRTDKYAAIYMRKQGYGRIINISSVSGLKGTEKLATYCMTKFGIIGLTKTLALELRNTGLPIYCNVVCPTKVRTPMCETQEYVDFVNSTMGKDFANWQEMFEDQKNPGGLKFLDPIDVTNMVTWLGDSDAATKFTGPSPAYAWQHRLRRPLVLSERDVQRRFLRLGYGYLRFCGRIEYAGAMGAAGGAGLYLFQAEGAGGRFLRYLLRELRGCFLRLVDALHQAEHHQCDDQELDDGVDEVAVGECGRIGAHAQRDLHLREVDAAREQRYQRHDEVGDDGVDDGGERTADDDGNGQVHDVAPRDEFAEFGYEAALFCHEGFSLDRWEWVFPSEKHLWMRDTENSTLFRSEYPARRCLRHDAMMPSAFCRCANRRARMH